MPFIRADSLLWAILEPRLGCSWASCIIVS